MRTAGSPEKSARSAWPNDAKRNGPPERRSSRVATVGLTDPLPLADARSERALGIVATGVSPEAREAVFSHAALGRWAQRPPGVAWRVLEESHEVDKPSSGPFAPLHIWRWPSW